MVTNVNYPKKSFVSGITNDIQAVATFTAPHDFIVGEIVSFRVTRPFGMIQIQNVSGKVLDTTEDTITVDIDSSSWDPFDYSLIDTAGTTPPTCVPAGSGVTLSSNISTMILADAFDNRRS